MHVKVVVCLVLIASMEESNGPSCCDFYEWWIHFRREVLLVHHGRVSLAVSVQNKSVKVFSALLDQWVSTFPTRSSLSSSLSLYHFTLVKDWYYQTCMQSYGILDFLIVPSGCGITVTLCLPSHFFFYDIRGRYHDLYEQGFFPLCKVI